MSPEPADHGRGLLGLVFRACRVWTRSAWRAAGFLSGSPVREAVTRSGGGAARSAGAQGPGCPRAEGSSPAPFAGHQAPQHGSGALCGLFVCGVSPWPLRGARRPAVTL